MKRTHHLIALGGLALILLAGVFRLPGQLDQLREYGPIFRAWNDPLNQYRKALGNVPLDLLLEAERLLPEGAAVLLVTSGADVRHLEYTTYHRALYYLTPRPVWWLSPAPPDGTWESRWWLSAPLTAGSIRNVAETHGISCVLAFQVTLPEGTGRIAADLGQGQLWSLTEGDERCLEEGSPSAVSLTASGPWPLSMGLSVATILVFGFAGVAIVRRAGYRPTGIEAAGLAWLFGAGLVTLAMLALNAIGLSLDQQRLTLFLFSIAGAAWLLWQSRPILARRPRWPARPSLTELSLVLLILFQSVFALLMTMARPLTIWDSWVNWAMKARTIFVEDSLSAAVYGDPSRVSTMLDYPLLVPLLESWLFAWLGEADDRLAGAQALLFFLALAAIVYAAIRRWGGTRTVALAVTAATLSIGHVVGMSTLVMADAPLTFLATTATIYLIDWLRDGSPGSLIVTATAAALMPWTKREGWILVAVLLMVTLVISAFAGRKRRPGPTKPAWQAVGAMLLATAIIAGPWQLFTAANSIPNPNFMSPTPAAFAANLNRLPDILRLVQSTLTSPPFNLVWIVAPLVLAALLLLRWRPPAGSAAYTLILPGVAFLYLLVMTVAYVLSDYAPYQQHVANSAFRLASHVVVLPVIWLGLLAASLPVVPSGDPTPNSPPR